MTSSDQLPVGGDNAVTFLSTTYQDAQIFDPLQILKQGSDAVRQKVASNATLDNPSTSDLYNASIANSSVRIGSAPGIGSTTPPIAGSDSHVAASGPYKNGPWDKIDDLLHKHPGSPTFAKSFADTQKDVPATLDARDSQKKHEIETERQHLNEWADRNLPPDQRGQFKKDMADFDTRASKDGLTPDEVSKTYQQIERITDATGDSPLTQEQRMQVAQTVMHNAADPTDIRQGYNGTCNVASVESRTYTRQPSAAAKLVADVAVTGEYKACDGTVVNVNTTPNSESDHYPPQDNERPLASQIFQTTAIDLHYARYNNMTDRNQEYEKGTPHKGKNDTGERVKDYRYNGHEEEFPGMNCQDTADISDLIMARNEKDVVLTAENGKAERGVTKISSEEELKAKLKDLKDHHKLPVIVDVDTNNEPFYSDSHGTSTGGKGAGHFVTITDYDENTGAVCIDNQWQKAADHGADNPVSVHDLYLAMQYDNAEPALKKEVDADAANGKVDEAKRVDLARHDVLDGTMSQADAAKVAEQSIDDMVARRKAGKLSDAEFNKQWTETESLIHCLSLQDQSRLVRKAYHDKLISTDWYKEELTTIGYQIEKNRRDANPNDRKAREKYFDDYQAWAIDANELSLDDNLEIAKNIRRQLDADS